MNDITPLLEQLATKLGTTTEYLWAAMLRQAPIDGVVWIIQTVFVVASVFVLRSLSLVTCRKIQSDDWDELGIIFGALLVLGWLFILILCVVIFFNISIILAAFFNPEYWALDQILSKLKPSS